MNFVVIIISSLISGIVGVLISICYYRRYEKRKVRIDTVKRFFSNRYDLKGDEFSRALNEIYIVFNGSSEVMSALADFHGKVVSRQNSEDALLKLHKALCISVGISFDKFNDSFFLTPFNTKESSMS